MRTLFLFLSVLLTLYVQATNIEGIVRDAQTGEVLIGASVFLDNNKTVGTTTGLDGTFVLKNIPTGKITLVCSYISYQTLEKTINIPVAGSQKLSLELVSYQNELQDVVITASSKTNYIYCCRTISC